MTAGVLCYPAISMLYAATLHLYLGSVYLFTAAIMIIAVINTLYIYRCLNKCVGTKCHNHHIILDVNETLDKISGLTTVV